MNLLEWKERIKHQLQELAQIDFGYELGENVIHLPLMDNDQAFTNLVGVLNKSVIADLSQFYKICDGLSFGDVQNGYFIKKVSELHDLRDTLTIRSIDLMSQKKSIVIIGSGGDGTLFGLTPEGKVLKMPPAKILDSVYYDKGDIEEIAGSLLNFLNIVLGDLTAFVEDEEDYQFLV